MILFSTSCNHRCDRTFDFWLNFLMWLFRHSQPRRTDGTQSRVGCTCVQLVVTALPSLQPGSMCGSAGIILVWNLMATTFLRTSLWPSTTSSPYCEILIWPLESKKCCVRSLEVPVRSVMFPITFERLDRSRNNPPLWWPTPGICRHHFGLELDGHYFPSDFLVALDDFQPLLWDLDLAFGV